MGCRKAALVINPRAGQNFTRINDVLAVLAAAGWKTKLGIKEYGGHAMELATSAARAHDLIVAYGGDGTLSQVVNGVLNSKGRHAKVGLIPGGTGNLWAGEIGIPIDPVKAALALVSSETRKVDVGHVMVQDLTLPNGNNGRQHQKVKAASEKKAKHHFLLMAGLGTDAAITGGVSKQLKYRVGPLAVGLSVAKELPAQRSFPIEIYAAQGDGMPLWKGEGVQVVVGNTRRFGIMEMTPNAYVDDGVLDVCVITAGDTLSTMQQITSLLLRRKPDNITAEYFHGAHLCIRVPASVPLQLDGSVVRLRDYLGKSSCEALQQAGDEQQVMVTYRFDALPRVLDMAVPPTYNDALFRESDSVPQETVQVDTPQRLSRPAVQVSIHKRDEDPQTDEQRHTEAHTARPESEIHGHEESKQEPQTRATVPHEVLPLLKGMQVNGRKVTVVGKAQLPYKADTFVIAGSCVNQNTGDTKPVAIVVDKGTTILNQQGQHVALAALDELQEGMAITVEGKKSKRGVIRASCLLFP